MEAATIKDEVTVASLNECIKIHLFIQCIKKGFNISKFSERELSILSELYIFGGLNSKDDFEKFFNICKTNKIIAPDTKNEQSIRNALSKARGAKIVKRPTASKWFITTDILPKTEGLKVLQLNYSIINVKVN
jgi:hypothetical protein